MKLNTFDLPVIHHPAIEPSRTAPLPDAGQAPSAIPRQRPGQGGVFSVLDQLDFRHLPNDYSENQALFSAVKTPVAVAAPQPASACPAAPSVDALKKPDAILTEASPMRLNEYINLNGYSQKLHDYTGKIDKYINNNDMRRYDKYQTDDDKIGSGSSKTCFKLNKTHVLLVQEKMGTPLSGELLNLKLLKDSGFPTVDVLKAGKIPDRYSSNSTNQAMIQERLENFYTVDRVTPQMHRDFINSPLLNENTLKSLKLIRNLMRTHNVTVGDFQGGLDSGGIFKIADIKSLSRAGSGDIFEETRMKNFDKLIRDMTIKLRS